MISSRPSSLRALLEINFVGQAFLRRSAYQFTISWGNGPAWLPFTMSKEERVIVLKGCAVFSPQAKQVMERFLDCGDLVNGSARIKSSAKTEAKTSNIPDQKEQCFYSIISILSSLGVSVKEKAGYHQGDHHPGQF
jgi:hypothetical protein